MFIININSFYTCIDCVTNTFFLFFFFLRWFVEMIEMKQRPEMMYHHRKWMYGRQNKYIEATRRALFIYLFIFHISSTNILQICNFFQKWVKNKHRKREKEERIHFYLFEEYKVEMLVCNELLISTFNAPLFCLLNICLQTAC